MADGTLIICAPADGEATIPGSVERMCADCERRIMVAPSGLDIAKTAEPPVAFVCIVCGHARIENDPDPRMQTMTSAQRDELARYREHHA